MSQGNRACHPCSVDLRPDSACDDVFWRGSNRSRKANLPGEVRAALSPRARNASHATRRRRPASSRSGAEAGTPSRASAAWSATARAPTSRASSRTRRDDLDRSDAQRLLRLPRRDRRGEPAQPPRRGGQVHRLARQRPGRGRRRAPGGGQRLLAVPRLDGGAAEERRTARSARNAVGAPMLDPATWPNTGIGRVNLDGSRGACSACHSRHAFSKAMARQPEVCGKCHLGPDHPQAEIYDESKHGIAYRTQKAEMRLEAEKWVVGGDYTGGPDLLDLPHVRDAETAGHPRRRRAHLLDAAPRDLQEARELGSQARRDEGGLRPLPRTGLRGCLLQVLRRHGRSVEHEVRASRRRTS